MVWLQEKKEKSVFTKYNIRKKKEGGGIRITANCPVCVVDTSMLLAVLLLPVYRRRVLLVWQAHMPLCALRMPTQNVTRSASVWMLAFHKGMVSVTGVVKGVSGANNRDSDHFSVILARSSYEQHPLVVAVADQPPVPFQFSYPSMLFLSLSPLFFFLFSLLFFAFLGI